MRFQEGSRQVIIVAYYFPPENTSGATRPNRFYKYLPHFGYQPEVITSSEQDPGHPLPGVHYVPGIRAIDKGTLKGWFELILRKYFLSHCENVTWIAPAIAAAKSVLAKNNRPAILSTSPPATPHFVAMRLKQQLGIPWIADFRDPMVGNPFLRPGGWHKQVDERMEPFIFSRADLVIANTENVAESWRRRYPQHGHKIRVLWNGFDPEENVGPIETSDRERRTLVHAGSLYDKRHPGQLLRSLERLIANGELNPATLQVELIGSVDDASMPARLNSFERVFANGCLHYDGVTIPRRDALRRLGEADYLLLVDVQDVNAGSQAPAKIFDYLRVGRSILAFTTRGSASDQILAKSGISHTCVYVDDTDDCVDRKVMAFLDRPPETGTASAWFYENFDGIEQTRALASFLDSL